MFYFPFHIWDVILPTDELIFSRWFFNLQPDKPSPRSKTQWDAHWNVPGVDLKPWKLNPPQAKCPKGLAGMARDGAG